MGKDDSNESKLLKLIQENPGMSIIPMVDVDVIAGNEFNRYGGVLGDCEIREYVFRESGYGGGVFYYKGEDDLAEYIAEDEDGLHSYEERLALAKEKVSKIQWNKAIFVNVDEP